MKIIFYHRAPLQLCYCCAFFLLLFVACEKKEETKIEENEKQLDSVSVWVEQLKNTNLATEDREFLLEKAYNYTSTIPSEKVQSENYSKLAFEAVTMNNDELFRKVNYKAMLAANRLQDTFKLGDVHWNYAAFYGKKEVVDSAYYHYHKAYEQFKLLDHKYYTAKMLYNIAFIQGRLKDYTGSEVSIFEAISNFEKLDKYQNLYNCYNYLGIIYYNLEEFERAIYYYNKALNFLEKIKDIRNYKEGSLSNLGLVYQKQKRYDKAIDNFNEALKNKSNLKSRDISFYARLIDNIAYTKFLSGDTVLVEKELFKALKIRDSINDVLGIVISKRHLSEFYAYKLDTVGAVKLADEAYSLAGQVENNRDKLETLLLLSKVDNSKASRYLNEYVHLNDSLQIEERKTRNKFTRIKFETDEYIEETEKLSQQKIFISIGALFVFLLFSFAYYIRIQSNKNKELKFEQDQQKANQEIFSLMLKQQSKLEEGRLNERSRIAQDLHDGVLGRIFGTRLGLGFLNVKGSEETIEKHKNYIDELQNIEKEIRTISHELKNEILSSKEDFSKIITDLIEQNSKLGEFKYEFSCDSEIVWDVINDDVKINFYRIIQEALQNIIKYSRASKVLIYIELEDVDKLNLTIKDNGVGFDAKAKRKGIGLKNMQSRVRKIKGVFNINSKINKGTTIFVSCSPQNTSNE